MRARDAGMSNAIGETETTAVARQGSSSKHDEMDGWVGPVVGWQVGWIWVEDGAKTTTPAPACYGTVSRLAGRGWLGSVLVLAPSHKGKEPGWTHNLTWTSKHQAFTRKAWRRILVEKSRQGRHATLCCRGLSCIRGRLVCCGRSQMGCMWNACDCLDDCMRAYIRWKSKPIGTAVRSRADCGPANLSPKTKRHEQTKQHLS